MKLGVLGALPRTFGELTEEAIRGVRAMGFVGTGLPAGDDPAGVTTDRARQIGRMFADGGVELVEYGRYGTNLVTLDGAARRAHIASLGQACGVSRAAGCPAVITGAGSMNPRGAWFPHRDNSAPATRDRLVASLKEAVKYAEDEGVLLGLECHTVTPLSDAATTKSILEEVGSKALKVHLDPINWMTWETIYNQAPAIQRMFDTLGADRLLGAHDKGAAVEDRLIIHISEAVTGQADDIFDHAALLRAASTMPPGFFVVIEHLKIEEMAAARAHLLEVARSIGVPFEN